VQSAVPNGTSITKLHSNYLSSQLSVSIVYAHRTAAVAEYSATAAAAAALETAVEAAADTITEHCSCVLVFRQPQQCPITFLAPTADADSLYSDVFLRASSSGSSSSSNNSRRKGSGKGKANSSSKQQQQQQQLEDAQSDTATATTAVTVTTGSEDLLTGVTSAVDVAAALRLPGFQVIWQLTTKATWYLMLISACFCSGVTQL
jgi:Mg-chelatase subunit ChlI